MPYVRFRGARTPRGSARELVRYEDAAAPCQSGLGALMAEARRSVEAQVLSQDKASQAVERSLDTRTYDGLQHVGGICIVDEPDLRPSDDIITKEEYDRERTVIEGANVKSRRERQETIERSADLMRRPLPAHEAMKWRTRIEIVSHAELDFHVPYRVGDMGYAYMRARTNAAPTGEIGNIVDIYHHSEDPIAEALLLGREAAELLADLLAVAAYAPARVMQIHGTTPPYCHPGEPFELASFSGFHCNSPVPVGPAVLEAFVDPGTRFALRNARVGLSTPLPTEAFASFWNSAEVIAQERAEREGWRRTVKCQGCGATRAAGWDLKLGFNHLYDAAGVKDDPFDRHRSIRGRVQHGTTPGDIADQRSVHSEVGALRIAAVAGVAESFGVRPQVPNFLSADQWPISVWSCSVEGDAIRTELRRCVTQMGMANLPQRVCGEQGRDVRSGADLNSQPSRLAVPPVIER